MKKLMAALLCVLMLAGCSDAYAAVSNKNETVFKVGNTTVTRGELYSYMQAQDGGYTAINTAMETILNAKVAVTEEMTANAEETLSLYESLLGENLESYLMSMGYPSLEVFKGDLIMSEQASEMTAMYIEANFDSLCTTYVPRKVKIATFADQESAAKAQAALTDGTDFEEVSETYGNTASTSSIIFTTKSSYPTNVSFAVSTLEDGQVSDVISSDDAATFYVVVMEAANPADFKEEAVSTIAGIDTISSDAMMEAFKEAGFAIYDKNLYDAISTNYPDYIAE